MDVLSKTLAVAVTAALAFAALSIAVLPDGSDAADSSFTIEFTLGGEDESVSFDGPTDKVIAFGYAMCLTIIDAGKSDMIYACDKYGNDAFTDSGLTAPSNSVATLMSSSNVDAIHSTILQAKDAGDISLDDAIILTTYETSSKSVYDKLVADGFTHVVYYKSMSDFGDLIKCISEVEKIVGSDKKLAEGMQTTYDTVVSTVKDLEKTDAIYLRTNSKGEWGYGSYGSICAAMIEAGGGNNLGYNKDKSGTIYDQSAIIQKLGDSPEAVIFLDSSYVKNGVTVQDFVDDLMQGDLGDHTVCVVKKTWNNYDPEAADGLLNMAAVMHPDEFPDVNPETYSESSDEEDNTLIYVAVGTTAAVLLVGVIIVLRLRH